MFSLFLPGVKYFLVSSLSNPPPGSCSKCSHYSYPDFDTHHPISFPSKPQRRVTHVKSKIIFSRGRRPRQPFCFYIFFYSSYPALTFDGQPPHGGPHG